MGRAELDRHKTRSWGRNYAESDDGYSDMEAEQRLRGWTVIPSWGSDGWDLGRWPLIAFYVRDWPEHPTDPHGRHELLEIVEGDRTLWRFTTEDDRAAAIDYLFLWYAAHEHPRWSPVKPGDVERLEAGVLPVDEKWRGPYRDRAAPPPAPPAGAHPYPDPDPDDYDAGVIAGMVAGRRAAETGADTITVYDPDRTPWKDGYADGFPAGYHGAAPSPPREQDTPDGY